MGSSPHMRGTHVVSKSSAPPNGIIPAHAGNTPSGRTSACGGRDHPRTCGEHAAVCAVKGGQSGSSPHMRGTHARCSGNRRPPGIIPAHAGNTHVKFAGNSAIGDHPRTCGEHLGVGGHWLFPLGSSPHMRGTPSIVPGFVSGRGIIPAHAGNTIWP